MSNDGKILKHEYNGPKFSAWISVKDRLPKNDRNVLVWQKYNEEQLSGPRIMWYKINSWNGPGFGCVTHWMPLPEPPQE